MEAGVSRQDFHWSFCALVLPAHSTSSLGRPACAILASSLLVSLMVPGVAGESAQTTICLDMKHLATGQSVSAEQPGK